MLKLLVILYYLLCAGYGVYVFLRRQENGVIKAIIITFLPLLGFFLNYYLFRLNKVKRKELDENYKVKKSLNNNLTIKPIYTNYERNLIPINDALLLNDHTTRRKLLIHSLKENIHNPTVLKQALINEDSETSHYAATAIMEMKRQLQNKLQTISSHLGRQPENSELIKKYVDTIRKYLDSGFIDVGTYHKYQLIQSDYLDRLIENGEATEQHYIDKINCEIELKNYSEAREISEEFMMKYPNEESAYIMAIKVQVALKDRKGIEDTIRKIKEQSVYLSQSGKNIIRYWA